MYKVVTVKYVICCLIFSIYFTEEKEKELFIIEIVFYMFKRSILLMYNFEVHWYFMYITYIVESCEARLLVCRLHQHWELHISKLFSTDIDLFEICYISVICNIYRCFLFVHWHNPQ